jgi:hypothetical protein
MFISVKQLVEDRCDFHFNLRLNLHCHGRVPCRLRPLSPDKPNSSRFYHTPSSFPRLLSSRRFAGRTHKYPCSSAMLHIPSLSNRIDRGRLRGSTRILKALAAKLEHGPTLASSSGSGSFPPQTPELWCSSCFQVLSRSSISLPRLPCFALNTRTRLRVQRMTLQASRKAQQPSELSEPAQWSQASQSPRNKLRLHRYRRTALRAGQ